MNVIRLTAIRDRPLSADEMRLAVAGPAAGAIALFAGTVRDDDHGRPVTRLSYSAHPSAEAELRRIAEKVHRVGDLAVGDLAVVAAVSCPHRAEAIEGCRVLIDEIKAGVPIWKHQYFADGSDEWVNSA